MARGDRHELEGLLLGGSFLPVLRVDGGGEWRLDLPGRYRKLIGRRVRVWGIRSDFDLLDVERVEVM